jgi:hypothetical protein
MEHAFRLIKTKGGAIGPDVYETLRLKCVTLLPRPNTHTHPTTVARRYRWGNMMVSTHYLKGLIRLFCAEVCPPPTCGLPCFTRCLNARWACCRMALQTGTPYTWSPSTERCCQVTLPPSPSTFLTTRTCRGGSLQAPRRCERQPNCWATSSCAHRLQTKDSSTTRPATSSTQLCWQARSRQRRSGFASLPSSTPAPTCSSVTTSPGSACVAQVTLLRRPSTSRLAWLAGTR